MPCCHGTTGKDTASCYGRSTDEGHETQAYAVKIPKFSLLVKTLVPKSNQKNAPTIRFRDLRRMKAEVAIDLKRTREKGRGKRKAALIGLKRRKWRRKEIVLEKQYIIEKMDTSISGGEIS